MSLKVEEAKKPKAQDFAEMPDDLPF
jgi:hypothetical protein